MKRQSAMEVSMKKTLFTVFALVAGLLIVSRPVAAHHGAAAFENDPAKRLVLKGTVVEWTWSNPHTFLQFDVKASDGQTIRWVVEASNPPDMVNRGWSIKSFKPGDFVDLSFLRQIDQSGMVEKIYRK